MDYYQGAVNEYLRANRATFINTEFCIQLGEGNPDLSKGSSWYCDAVALNFEEPAIYLCEVSFAEKLPALRKRLMAWSQHWETVKLAVIRDGHLNPIATWAVRPWVFIPAREVKTFREWEASAHLAFDVRLTHLEDMQPWQYRSWDRKADSPIEGLAETS